MKSYHGYVLQDILYVSLDVHTNAWCSYQYMMFIPIHDVHTNTCPYKNFDMLHASKNSILHAIFCLHVHDSIWPKCMHAKECKIHVSICLHACAHTLHSFCIQFACILLACINLHAGCMHCFLIACFLLTFAFIDTDINLIYTCMFINLPCTWLYIYTT